MTTLYPKTRSGNVEACEQRVYHITAADLPLSCPMPNMRLWNSHPRVFLPIKETGHERCPYCGAEFILENHSNRVSD